MDMVQNGKRVVTTGPLSDDGIRFTVTQK